MAIPKQVLKAVRERDPYCVHCGQEDDLVPHHRINRGMGGSKKLDTVQNLMMVCALYNGEMESDVRVQSRARGWGHKLSVWESYDKPVFDSQCFRWWVLLENGWKVMMQDDIPF